MFKCKPAGWVLAIPPEVVFAQGVVWQVCRPLYRRGGYKRADVVEVGVEVIFHVFAYNALLNG